MRKKTIIILVILIALVSIIGVSYASWLFTGRQKDFNTLGSKCFELTMMNESEGITLDKTYPISDEEGLSTTGYTFTIKNTCNTYATYEVNLEDMLVEAKRLSGEYIKVSVNDGRPINLKELEEKEPTIKEADKSYELTSGTLAPEEETTYTIKLWMDESTPAIEETMNATFLSKVSIEAGYIEEEKLENEILLEAKSITESLNNQSEIFEITGTSTNYNLIEYSLDNSHWSRIESPSKNIVITEEFTEEGKYSIYVRDEVGNIKSIEIETTKLDKTVPEIKIEETDNQESIELDITFTDNKELGGYEITTSKEEPTEWNEISGKETNIKYTLTENTTYYIWVKDSVGNQNYQMYSTDTIDTVPPELTISNTLTEWGTRDTITIQATDDVIGISGISISTSEDTYNWEVIENTLRYETTKEIEENGTYYISVRDGYGHITTKSIVIDKVDNMAPILSDIQNSSNGAWAKSITLSWEITEEENPQFKDVILNNLVAYEPASDFAQNLANAGFRKTDAFDTIYDTHVQSIIEIRKLLAQSELKPMRNTILKNRQDWIDIGLPTPNRYMMGFQFSEQIADIRKAAFEYDMKNGITQKEADFMIKELSADTSVAKKSLKEVLEDFKDSKISQEHAETLFKELMDDKKLLAKQIEEADLSNVKTSDFVLSELATKSDLINKHMANIFDEFEKYGINRKQTQKYLAQLTTERKLTETQEKYGMTLDEMIDKINKAIVD